MDENNGLNKRKRGVKLHSLKHHKIKENVKNGEKVIFNIMSDNKLLLIELHKMPLLKC